MTLLAVYGTLRTGFGNNKYCLANSTSLGLGYVNGIRMHNTGWFPICCETDDITAQVIVEVFETTDIDLAYCDNLEGHPNWYCRQPVEVLTEDGEIVKAEMYLKSPEACGDYSIIWSGDWTKKGGKHGV